ncbi:AAA family ATPase [Cellulomonas sp. zg-ZUI222]|uniref:AAA family ATPase n=1 Tax=Cellulomonas wangleii TaxID=2816956 RepID=A0ABX8D697_9CELL|nr:MULTISPECIES: AAA family ATPase [Cellulomonas]MBO0901365.1 AAA family ATPase [Cellulomonas sp. zg-ZUI22]MBO0921811.1 AAA family ATPase [Cellulomonas wangleii]MBO0924767.1 AAA family ATPase [Cellulomonas wangleii]QVI62944.1 AAA family ATPase [Cellulomonas wangleii]
MTEPTSRARPLVGRGAELDDIDELLSSVATGGGATVLLEGEAGVGRTRLVEALQGAAGLLGIEVCLGRAVGPAAPPYTLLTDALLGPSRGRDGRGPVVAELAALLEVLPPERAGAPARFARADELFAALVRRRGELGPWVLALDDVHLADPCSLHLLADLAGEGALPSALTVMTMRGVPHRAELDVVVAGWTRAGARYLELRPLGPAATVELAEHLLRGSVGPALRGVLSTTGGNPRLVVDVLRTAEACGVLERSGGVVEVVGTGWLDELDEVGRAHVQHLGPHVLTMLGQASVLGTSFVVGDLAALAGEPVTECWRTLRHGLAAGVVHARGDRLVFRHDLVRTSLYAGLDEGQRRALHARAAWALRAAGAPPHVVAAHLERAR